MEREVEMSSETETETQTQVPPPTLSNLITALEEATQIAKQLTNTPSQIYSALNSAQTHLSHFLSQSLENSVSSSDEPMEIGDNEQISNSKAAVDKVEERMRECFIQNKRPKRPLSPSADQRNRYEVGNRVPEFDPYGDRLRALDLVYQFNA